MGQTPDYPQKKNKTPLILGALAMVLVLGGVGVFFAVRGGGPTPNGGPDATNTATTSTPTPTAAPPPTQTVAPTQPAADTPKPADTSATAGTPSPTGTPAGGNGGKPVVGGPLAKADPKTPDPKTPEPKAPEPKAPEPKAPEPAASGKDFDRGAASAALGGASGAARGCKKADGPTGTARVRVTFAPNGSVTSASVDGAPFAGTAVGGCIAAAFRGAHIPAFDGSPVSVTKSVSIN